MATSSAAIWLALQVLNYHMSNRAACAFCVASPPGRAKMLCTNCQVENSERAITCIHCGSLLDASRVSYQLALAGAAKEEGDHERVAVALSRAGADLRRVPATVRRSFASVIHFYQGWLYFNQRLPVQAEDELLSAELGLAPQGRPAMLAETLNLLGHSLIFQNRPQAAATYFQRSGELAQANGLAPAAILALSNLAGLRLDLGAVEAAVCIYQLVLSQAEASGDLLAVARSHRNLARLYGRHGPYSRALAHADQAIALRSVVSNHAQLARLLSEAAIVYQHAGLLSQATGYLYEARALLQGNHDHIARVVLAMALTELLWLKGSYEPWYGYAIMVLEDDLAGFLYSGEPAFHLARYYISQQEWAQARRLLHRLAAIAESQRDSLNPSDRSYMDYATAILQAGLGETAVALDGYRRVLRSGLLIPYQQATALVEYARLLYSYQRSPDLDYPNPARSARAALLYARHLYCQLELPHRQAQVDSLLAVG